MNVLLTVIYIPYLSSSKNKRSPENKTTIFFSKRLKFDNPISNTRLHIRVYNYYIEENQGIVSFRNLCLPMNNYLKEVFCFYRLCTNLLVKELFCKDSIEVINK